METITLSAPLVNNILQYLGSRPFVEVAGLIQEIQKQANENAEPPADTPTA